MAEWAIYGKNGVAKASVKELELHDEWMAECFITVSVKSAEPIDFAVGDYIDYRNERYSINYDPSKIKKARRGTYGEGFVYDNIKFVAVQDELVRCDFCDIVLSDNNIHYTQLSTFPFYCETVDDLLDRIQANMEDLYPGAWIIISPDLNRDRQRGLCVDREQAFIDAYNKYIGEGSEFTYDKTGVSMTVDNINCWEALAKAHSDFGLNFIVRGRIVIVGTAGVFTQKKFSYGRGNGLYELEAIGDSEQKIVTRLRAYGSEENLPDRYYAERNLKVFSTVTEIENKFGTDSYTGISFFTDLKFSAKYFTYRSQSYPGPSDRPNYIVRMEANGHEVTGFVSTDYSSDNFYIYSEYKYDQSDDRDEENLEEMDAFVRALNVGAKVYFTAYVEKGAFDLEHQESGETSLPDNMAVNKLMLPGFPDMSLNDWVQENRPELIDEGFEFSDNPIRPYIDSPNKEKYDIRPSNIFFDGTDDTNDIHPTIEGMTWDGHACDEVLEAQQIDDNGVLSDNSKEADKRVIITIPYAGFNLDEEWKDGATINMKDGMCGARDFKIVKKPTKDDDGNWKCICERAYDSVLKIYFPYSDFQIHTGDKFVLTGIDLPDSYIEAASVRLFDAAMDALKKNHLSRVTYQPKIDHIWMAHQHDTAVESGGLIESLHDTLKAGDYFSFADEDLNIDASIIIDILTIKENGDNGLPTYEITLRDEKVVSTLEKRLEKIVSGGGGNGGSYSMRQTGSFVEQIGDELYLSKIEDDDAAGSIGFMKSAWFGAKQWIIDNTGSANLFNATINGLLKAYNAVINTVKSTNYTGEGMLDTGYRLWYENGRAKLVIDDLIARGKFSVYNLESRIMTYVGGNIVFSGAGSKIFYVEYIGERINASTGLKEEYIIGYTSINSPWMLGGKLLIAGTTALAAWSNRITIQKRLSDEEKLQVRKFRCYVFSDDGTMKTRNWWHVHDLARSQTYDHTQMKQTSQGYYSGDNVSNTVYWRRVAGIGSKVIEGMNDGKIRDYFDLWNVLDVSNEKYIDSQGVERTIGYDIEDEEYTTPGYDTTYNDWPVAGDDVVQFGNARDLDRQAMVTIEVTGGEPGFQIYNGVHTYRMDNTKWVGIGYNATTKRAYSDVFGDFYFGERGSRDVHDGSTYVRYDAGTKRLDIKAHITAASTYGDDDLPLDDYILGVTWSKEDIEEMIGDGVEVVQNQLDGNFSIWYKDIAPLPLEDSAQGAANAPASGWNTDALKEEHLYDMYYDRIADRGYRWTSKTVGDVKKYYWEQIGNNSILASLRAAADAQDTADGKRRVFICDGETHETPTPPYDEGDLWVNADYIDPTTHEVVFDNDLVRCNHTRATGNFSISDWEKASKYTDDSGLINFVDVTYNADMAQLHKQIDGKIDTYFTDTDPSTSWTAAQKEEHVDDVWFNTDSERLFRYKKTESGGTVSYSWDEIYDDMALQAYKDATKAQDTADGKRRVFVAQPAADDEYDIGDLWVNATYGTTYSNDLLRCKTHKDAGTAFNISHWEKASKYTDDSSFNSYINEIINGTGASGDAKTAADAARVLNGALKAKTEQDGGLMLTSTLVMRNKNNDDSYTTWGGLNGVYSSGSTIAAWFGGGMIDHEASGSPSTGYATSLFRMNGSGYVAGGNISWNASGEVTIQGKVVQATTIKIGTTNIESYFVKKAWFDEIFQVFNDTARIHSNDDLPTDKSKVNIKAMFGFWTEFYLSALGTGGQSSLNIYLSQLGDVNVSGVQTGQYLKYDGQRWIASSVSTSTSLAALTDVNVNGVSDGQALIYDGNLHKWIPGESGLVRQVNVGNTPYSPTNGVVTLPAYPTTLPASDVSAWAKANTKPSYNLDEVSDGTTRKLSDYLPKSGGAMTGVITRDAGGAWIKARDNAVIKTVRTSGQGADWHPAVAIKTSSGCWSFGSVGGETLALSYDTDANYTADNNESSVIYFPSAGSTGTLALTSQFNDYLPKSGGTLTGILNITTNSRTVEIGAKNNSGIHIYNDNNSPTFFNGGVSSNSDGSYDLGTSTFYWNVAYTNRIIAKSTTDAAANSANTVALITGEPTGQHLEFDGNEIMSKASGTNVGTLYINDGGGNVCICNAGGSVGIGTTTPAYKLHVVGNIYASSGVTALSDERKKDIVEDVSLTVEQVAEAPSVKFLWKDGNDKELHVGSIAQYWQKVLPETVISADGVLSMDYSTISLASAVATARKVVDQQQEIDRLKAEIEDMKKMIRQLVKEK